ncbi:MAG TPA: DUF309 domain-containing protein [Thermoanaerobaculia bacterium]
MRALLVDLGNVLVRFDHGLTLARIAAATGVPEGELRPHLFGPLEAEFDLGRLTADAFFRAVERAAGLRPLPDHIWIPAWRDIFTPVPSALAALGHLARDVTPVLISNTNSLHWEGVLAVLPELPGLVPLRALSFEVGAAKPEAAHFEAAFALAGAHAGNALYVDDSPKLVAAARSLGIDAFVVSGPEDLAGELLRMGLLSRETARRFSGGASPLFVKGLEEFRAGRFFEAHEEWELLWKDSSGDDRVFLQGLIQVAAARLHLGRGNPASAARLLALAKEKLDRFEGDQAGIRIDSLFPS